MSKTIPILYTLMMVGGMASVTLYPQTFNIFALYFLFAILMNVYELNSKKQSTTKRPDGSGE
jgi:hypothetical protein